MTRKDYQLIAGVLASAFRDACTVSSGNHDEDLGYQQAIVDVADQLAYRLQRDNPAFDADRFRAACGLAVA